VELGVSGVRVGHWTDDVARTGCTVILLPPDTVASGEVRGGAPASREFALLDPTRLVPAIDAVVLAGGSAFGLASADGVMEVLEQQDRGFPTAHGRVPIVVGLALYDLGVGAPEVRPDAAAGRHAVEHATDSPATGAVGAGVGATLGNWRGADHVRPGGLGIAVVRRDDLVTVAVVATNAAGEIDDGSTVTAVVDGSFADWPEPYGAGTNTTIGAVITNAKLDKVECRLLAEGAHDGLARAVVPPHMRADGDAFVAAATGEVVATVDDVRFMAVIAVERAVRGSVASIEG
jgi:L-aminopeptidase/D-esterase-like protein